MPVDSATTPTVELCFMKPLQGKDIPDLILNLREYGCLLKMNLMGWSVDCLCRSVAEISCNSRLIKTDKTMIKSFRWHDHKLHLSSIQKENNTKLACHKASRKENSQHAITKQVLGNSWNGKKRGEMQQLFLSNLFIKTKERQVKIGRRTLCLTTERQRAQHLLHKLQNSLADEIWGYGTK